MPRVEFASFAGEPGRSEEMADCNPVVGRMAWGALVIADVLATVAGSWEPGHCKLAADTAAERMTGSLAGRSCMMQKQAVAMAAVVGTVAVAVAERGPVAVLALCNQVVADSV